MTKSSKKAKIKPLHPDHFSQIVERGRQQLKEQGLPIKPSLREDEAATLKLVQAVADHECYHCHDTGYRGLPELAPGQYGLTNWELAGVSIDAIPWCDCETAHQRKAQYGRNMQGRGKARAAAMFKNAGIPPRFRGLTLNGIPNGLKQGKEAALAATAQFIRDGHVLNRVGKKREGIVLIGKPNMGKTGILSVAFRRKVEGGVEGLWVELYKMFTAVQDTYNRPDKHSMDLLEAAAKVPLLFLDDIGDPNRRSGRGSILAEENDKRQKLWYIVEHRHAHGLPILGTSNLSRSEMETQWGTRLVGRLWECCVIIAVTGADLREEM